MGTIPAKILPESLLADHSNTSAYHRSRLMAPDRKELAAALHCGAPRPGQDAAADRDPALQPFTAFMLLRSYALRPCAAEGGRHQQAPGPAVRST